MDYKLAKKLKDEGFSQQGKGDKIPDQEDMIAGLKIVQAIYVPTLFELIKACGEKFDKLFYRPQNKDAQWFAARVWEGPVTSIQVPMSKGSTAEEAVAKLWLSLKNKNDITKTTTTK